MKKYYRIPMTERIVKVDGISLFEILQKHYPDLYNREKGRVELMYGGSNPGVMTPQLEEAVKDYNQETDVMYHALGVPKYIIAIKDESGIREYATKTTLEVPSNGSILTGREVSQTTAYQYLDSTTNYIGITNKMFVKEENKSLKKSRFQQMLSALSGRKDN